jgi:hypothetical protein
MLDSDYIDIRKAVEATDYKNDSFLFHQTVDRLALMLGFTKKKEWYEAEAEGPKIKKLFLLDQLFEFKTLADLEACIRLGMLFNYFEHNAHYEKSGESFKASTLYKDHMSLVLKEFGLCTVTSKSTLGLNYKVIPHNEFNLIYPRNDSRSDVMRALDNKCLIQMDNNFLMNPKYLLRLAEQKGIFR